MPSGHSGITACLNEGEVARGAAALAAPCVREGLREVATPGRARLRHVLSPVPLDDFKGTTFEVCADLVCAGPDAVNMGLFDSDSCLAIAREVGGANGELLWTSGEDFSGAWSDVQEAMMAGGTLPVEDGVLLQFEAATPGLAA